jgi:hypothetical protein
MHIENTLRRLRCRVAGYTAAILLAVGALSSLGLAVSAPASAGIDPYCNPCAFIEPGEGRYDGYHYYITLSYGHNLAGGTVCSGAHNYASLICKAPESSHSYGAYYSLQGEIMDPNEYYINMNGHVDY